MQKGQFPEYPGLKPFTFQWAEISLRPSSLSTKFEDHCKDTGKVAVFQQAEAHIAAC